MIPAQLKRIVPALKNKDINWAPAYPGVLIVSNPDIYTLIFYIDQELSFDLSVDQESAKDMYIDQERAKTLER